MPNRPDMSDFLIHFTRSTVDSGAEDVLLKIIRERQLIGSDRRIKSHSLCICFTEAPIAAAAQNFSQGFRGRYEPYGVMISKPYAFALGARPVIYQPGEDYHLLHASMKWRHMRFDPETDFTWEREWRLPTQQLQLDPAHVTVIVPDEQAAASLAEKWEEAETAQWDSYVHVLDLLERAQYHQQFGWKVAFLAARS